jgi:DNA-binding LytR/AlgR family response regulator
VNILTVGGEGDKIPEHFLADGISCAHVASSRAALEAVRMRPGLFDIIVIGSSITDAAGGEDRECFLTICRINSKILIAICTGKKYISLDLCSIPSFFAFSAPFDADTVGRMIYRAEMMKWNCGRSVFPRIQVSDGRNKKMLLLDDIYYVKKVRNGLTAVTASAEYYYPEKMDSFSEIAGVNFLRCHSSISVNVDHVVIWEGSDLVLYGGEKIPVSRAYRKSVRDYFSRNSFLCSDAQK